MFNFSTLQKIDFSRWNGTLFQMSSRLEEAVTAKCTKPFTIATKNIMLSSEFIVKMKQTSKKETEKF